MRYDRAEAMSYSYAGKSQLMKYAARLSPRAIITSGKASSAAGLTATAVKEDSHWALEAGRPTTSASQW